MNEPKTETTTDRLQELYEKIDARRDRIREQAGDIGEVVGMGYCLDMILAMQRKHE
jgi:hypothetical protein